MEIILVPIVLTISAAILLWLGLRKLKPNYLLVTVSVGLLLVACGSIASLSASDGLGGAVAFMLSVYTTIVALTAGLLLLISLRGRRKLMALIIALVYPAGLFACAIIANDYSPEALSRKYADVIGQQLDQYHSDKGQYPTELAELVPVYLDDLREPKSLWGWLYKATQDEFTLGYVNWVDWWGCDVCVYTSDQRTWDCPHYFSSAPFNLPPTPSPSLY